MKRNTTDSSKKRAKKSKTTTSSSSTKSEVRSMIDNESLERVASPLGEVHTIAISPLDKQVILDRLKKEIVEPFGFSMSTASSSSSNPKRRQLEGESQLKSKVTKGDDGYQLAHIAQSRLVIGTNSCTRVMNKLFASNVKIKKGDRKNGNDGKSASTQTPKKPSLCVLCRDIRPPTILAHVPYLCQQLNIPIILLPGRASFDLGQALGAKTASVVLFLDRDQKEAVSGSDSDSSSKAEIKRHNQIDSYIEFVKEKLPQKN